MKTLVTSSSISTTTTQQQTTTSSTTLTSTSTLSSCQLNTKLNANKKIDELNSLLMSQLEIDSSHFKNTSTTTSNNNLTNLRDVLKAAHKINLINKKIDLFESFENTNSSLSQQQQKQEESLTTLIELLKLDNQDFQTRNNEIENLSQQPQFIINKIEKDLQDSLKLLKHYNDTLVIDEDEDLEDKRMLNNYKHMDDLFKKGSFNKYSRINEEDCKLESKRNDLKDQIEDELNKYNFNRNDLIRKNIFKVESAAEKFKKYQLVNPKKHDLSEAKKMIEFDKNVSSPSLRKIQNTKSTNFIQNSQRRNSIDQIPFSANCVKQSALIKSSTSQFNYEKLSNDLNQFNGSMDKTSSNNDDKTQLSSGFWNYDELNELKMKFISLLSENSNASKNDEINKSITQIEEAKVICALEKNTPKPNLNVFCVVDNNSNMNNQNKLSSMSFVSIDTKPISSLEQLKIESFYRSFGTSLFISQTCASLYTIPNSKISTQTSENLNRMSVLTTTSVRFTPEITKNVTTSEINHEIIKDLMNNRYQNYVPVYHRGVPLWLFNSGKNPRRPNRQLKFTLAEKGTGFILWQDRIDAHSDFNLYLIKKNESLIQNISSYFDNINLINEIKQEQVESMIITFKASDKKTTVFLKFDINTETIKFYDYYRRLIKNIIVDIKQRTKSLPVGLGSINKKGSKNDIYLVNRLKSTTQNATNINFYNYDYNLFENSCSSSPNKNKNKRQSYHIGTETSTPVKLKRITKNDISNPCNYKHIINLKPNDKNSYYTLSKLLPASISSTNSSNTPSPKSTINSTPSPSYSITSSSITSSPRSSSYLQTQNLITNANLDSNDYLIQENSRLSYNNNDINKSINHSTSCSSTSSLSTISPPIVKLTNTSNKFFETCSFNQKLSKQKTVK